MVNELSEELLDDPWLNVPVINFLLLEFIPCVPVGLHIVFGKVFGKAIGNQELFIFGQFSQLVLLLHHPYTIYTGYEKEALTKPMLIIIRPIGS